MKLTASILLLLFSFLAQAGELQQCPNLRNADGSDVYCDGENNSDCCGPTLSDGRSGANPDNTGVDGSVVTNRTGSPVIGCTHPKDDVPTALQIINGASPCIDRRVRGTVASVGRVDFNDANSNRFVTAAGTEFEISFVQNTGRGKLQVFTTTPFTTPAGAPGVGTDLSNTGVFVGCGAGASDSNTGQSHAQRWATLAKVRNSVTTAGTNIYLQTDCEFENQWLDIDHDGTAADPIELTTYCMDGSTPRKWTDGGTGCGSWATIEGTLDLDGCAADGDLRDCEYSLTGSANFNAVPVTQFRALLEIRADRGAAYVDVQYLNVFHSAGNGITISENLVNPSNATVQDVNCYGTMKRGCVHVSKAAPNSNAYFNRITDLEISLQKVMGEGGTHSSCWSIDSLDAGAYTFILIENSILGDCGGEGMSTLRTRGVVYRNNFVYNVRRSIAYPDASQEVVHEENTIIATGYRNNQNNNHSAFASGVECYGAQTEDSINNVFRNNVAYNIDDTAWAIRLFVEGENACAGGETGFNPRDGTGFGGIPKKIGAFIYGNSFFMKPGATVMQVTGANNGNIIPNGIEIFNNVFEGSNVTAGVTSAWNVNGNAWSTEPTDNDAKGPDDYYGPTGFSNDPTWSGSNQPSDTYFRVPTGSAILNGGVTLNDASLLDADNYPRSRFTEGCASMTDAQWEQKRYMDIECNVVDGTPHYGASEATR